jgi:hypothetical protein
MQSVFGSFFQGIPEQRMDKSREKRFVAMWYKDSLSDVINMIKDTSCGYFINCKKEKLKLLSFFKFFLSKTSNNLTFSKS